MQWPTLTEVSLEDCATGRDEGTGWVLNGFGSWWYCTNLPEGGLAKPQRIVEKGRVYSYLVQRSAGDRQWNGRHTVLTKQLFQQLQDLDSVGRDPRLRGWLEQMFPERTDPCVLPGVALVEKDMEDAGLREGDLLMSTKRSIPRGGRCWPLSVDHMRAVKEEAEHVRDLVTWRAVNWKAQTPIRNVIEDGRRWGLSAKEWRPKIRAYRPFDLTVSEPIHAGSDDAAIFELLASVGGRMPEGG